MRLNIHPECIEKTFLTFEISYIRNENLGTNKSVKHKKIRPVLLSKECSEQFLGKIFAWTYFRELTTSYIFAELYFRENLSHEYFVSLR